MKSIELNKNGNFDQWQPHLLNELKNENISNSLGQKILFEDEKIKIWSISLAPKERMPFRKIDCSYSFLAMTDAMIITRSCSGSICLHHIENGESKFIPFSDNKSLCDIENIGTDLVYFNLTEFKLQPKVMAKVLK